MRPVEVAERIAGEVAGRVVTEPDADYQVARRVWNGMIDRRPVAIVQAATIDDVPAVIRIAVESGLRLAVRGGGHNVAGNGSVDGGIVLDLDALKAVKVDAAAGTVRVEPGATLGDMDRATEPHALAVPSGVISGTGVAGLTLGGGVGWLTRAYGLTADNLLAADVVTARGERLHASDSQNADLFWGLRGGGGNFGVVTSFTFRAYPLGPSVFGANLFYGRPAWPKALRAYAEWTRGLPDEMTSIVTFMVPPPDWELGDEVLMIIGAAWSGPDDAEPEALIARLSEAAPPDGEVVEPTTWRAWQSAADGLFPRGVRAYWKNASFDRLDDPIIDALIVHAGRLTKRGAAADIHHMEGAFGRVPEDATPFPNRSARYWLNIYGYWGDAAEDPERIAWVRGFHTALQPHAMAGHYVNFLGDEGPGADRRALALEAYGAERLQRLVELKRRYDPQNLFRLNHNIDPS